MKMKKSLSSPPGLLVQLLLLLSTARGGASFTTTVVHNVASMTASVSASKQAHLPGLPTTRIYVASADDVDVDDDDDV